MNITVISGVCHSPNIIRVNQARRMRWARHAARLGERKGAYKVLMGNLRVRGPGVDVRIIIRWILGKWSRGMDWIDLAQDWNRWRALVNTVMNLRIL